MLVSVLDPKQTEAIRICRETGVEAVRQVASELDRDIRFKAESGGLSNGHQIANFDQLYDKLVEIGLPMNPDREKWRDAFGALRAEYEGAIRYVSTATLMPVDEPWGSARVPDGSRQAADSQQSP